MNTKTMRKAARDVSVGDVLVTDGGNRLVALQINWNGECIEITWGRLGKQDGANPIVNHIPDSQFTVELPAGLTQVQAKADDLLNYARMYLRDTNANSIDITVDERAALMDLLDELEPPKPPTLEEALDVLRYLERQASIPSNKSLPQCNDALIKARNLLARVPD